MEDKEAGKVESTREVFDMEKGLVPKEGAKLPAPWRYQHFVEGCAAEDIASKVGADPSKMARVFFKEVEGTKDIAHQDQVHIIGSPEVVKEVADGLRSPNRELHTWYIGQAETVEEERAVVEPALAELVRSIPIPIIDNPAEFIRKVLSLGRAIEAGAEVVNEAAKELGEALEGFEPGKNTREEIEERG